MNGSISLGTIGGIDIRIHVSFLLLLAFFAANKFAQGGVQAAIDYTLILVLIFICVFLHELGHAAGARLFNIRTSEIVLNFFGGLAQLEKAPRTPLQEAVIAFAGPLVNLVIAGVLYLVLEAAEESEAVYVQIYAYYELIWVVMYANVILAVFNLLPGYPLDGGAILRAALSTRMSRTTSRYIVARLGQVIAIGVGLYGFPNDMFLIVIALFLFFTAHVEAEATKPR